MAPFGAAQQDGSCRSAAVPAPTAKISVYGQVTSVYFKDRIVGRLFEGLDFWQHYTRFI